MTTEYLNTIFAKTVAKEREAAANAHRQQRLARRRPTGSQRRAGGQ